MIGLVIGAVLGVILGLIPCLGLEMVLMWSWGLLQGLPLEIAVGLITGGTLTYRVMEEARMGNPALLPRVLGRDAVPGELVSARVSISCLLIMALALVHLSGGMRVLVRVGTNQVLVVLLIGVALITLIRRSRCLIKALGYIAVAGIITWHLRDEMNGMFILGNCWLVGPSLVLNLLGHHRSHQETTSSPIRGLGAGLVSAIFIGNPISLWSNVVEGGALVECIASAIADVSSLFMALMGVGFRDTAASYVGWLNTSRESLPVMSYLVAGVALTLMSGVIAQGLTESRGWNALLNNQISQVITLLIVVVSTWQVDPSSLFILGLGVVMQCWVGDEMEPGLRVIPLSLLPLSSLIGG